MSKLTEQILKSGLIDKATAEMMEQWGTLPDGSTELVNEEALKQATRAQLVRFAENIGDLADESLQSRSTMLDLEKIRWPAQVDIYASMDATHTTEFGWKIPNPLGKGVSCLIDRMGRLYFRAQDVNPDWFVPGYIIERIVGNKGLYGLITEVQPLSIGEQVACYQVTLHVNH